MIRALLSLVSAALLCSCATRQHTYTAPDPGHLNASTARVSKAVDQAHSSARKAQAKVTEAVTRQKEISEEIRKLKDVPITLVEKINAQDATLADASSAQVDVENQLREATVARAVVEKDKTEYFAAGQKLADDATAERDKRIKDEKALSWYRWHWYGAWIVSGLGVLFLGLIAFLKFTGRLAVIGAGIASKIP